MVEIDERKIKAKETLDVLEDGFITSKRIHKGYEEFERAKLRHQNELSEFKLKQLFGKWQYFFEKGDMKISLVQLNDSPLRGEKDEWIWEIHAFDDKRLFDDVKKFRTKKDAIKEIRHIFGN